MASILRIENIGVPARKTQAGVEGDSRTIGGVDVEHRLSEAEVSQVLQPNDGERPAEFRARIV